MNNLYEQLVLRKEELSNAIHMAEKILCNSPEGSIRISKSAANAHYYLITDSKDTNGQYIRRSERELISNLVNKSYAEAFLKCAKSEYIAITKLLACKNMGRAENIYSELNEYRKPFVTPILMTDDEYLTIWENVQFKTNPYRPEDKVYETNRHEFVRSKSEKDIANLLDSMGIPYRYEAELVLNRGIVRYPDFTMLNIRTRENIYYEHFGLMDDSGYRRENLQKIGEYNENGIILGKNLLFSFEAQGCPLNMKNIKRMLREIMGL